MDASQVIIPSRPDDLVRRVGWELLEQGLGRGRSLFTLDRPIWSLEAAEELDRLYNGRVDAGADPFMVKLRRQLDGASDAAIQLTAELLTLHGLPLRNLSANKLSERVTAVLGWMSVPVEIPDGVSAAFEQHTWSGGIGAHTMLWKWLADAIDFLVHWWQIPADQRAAALDDAWEWLSVVGERNVVPSLRGELLYLRFPTHFLPIVSFDHKRAIRDAFTDDRTGSVDRDLFAITIRLQTESGGPVDFYRPPFVEQWRSAATKGHRRAWLVRPPQRDRQNTVEQWLTGSYVSVDASYLSAASLGGSRSQLRAAVDAGYGHLEYAQRAALTSEFYAFVAQMAPGDLVASLVGNLLYLGLLTGDPLVTHGSAELRRSADWQSTPIHTGSLPGPLSAELDQQGTVVDLTSALEVLTELLESSDEVEPKPRARERTTPALAPATDELAVQTHIERSWLSELIDLWQERRQIVLYGPPGTGKTFLARALARHVTDRDAVRLVQFHPSYAYEDFFEGFRPVEGTDGGPVNFVRTPGPLREVAASARDDPDRPYVLIIDEINRANLAKVFGELYYLLEYREETVRLQYSPAEAFNLPPNVFLIGTMNTADRSIALVDAAVRRRFAFVELHPDEHPVRDVLARWLAAEGRPDDERARLLTRLNQAIGVQDHDFKIGPSYLMRPNLDSDAALERVWRHDLLPLIEEHYYGRLDRAQVHSRFGLAAIRARGDAGES